MVKVWIENDIMGAWHVMVHYDHPKAEPFKYASFYYQYPYTDNQGALSAAMKLAVSLGATEPVEKKCAELPKHLLPKKRKPPKLQQIDMHRLID